MDVVVRDAGSRRRAASTRRTAPSVLVALVVAGLACAGGRDETDEVDGRERALATAGMPRGMPHGMMMDGDGMDPQMMRDMRVIHALLANHGRIRREVQDIPGGVRATTTSDDPEVAQLIRRHVRQMKARLAEGRPIRRGDPVFRELFRRREDIRLEVEEIPGGVRVVETSDDPEVTLLIRQHAHRAVSEFVEGGMTRAMRPTPLPEGYAPPAPD